MLKQLIAIWKQEPFVKKMVEKFGEMLSDGEYAYNCAWQVFLGKAITEQLQRECHEKDTAINSHEREIRRILLEHLSLHPKHDVSGCLVMMSMVKDAERIGDYAKNIFEVGIMMEGSSKDMKFLERLSATQSKIAEHFPKLRKAFLESDHDLANQLLDEYAPIKSECNSILHDLFSEQLPTREAVATALISRYLKRINSHMSNIASGIIYPLDQIDFVRGGILE